MTPRSTPAVGCLCVLMLLCATAAVAQTAGSAVSKDRAGSTVVMSLRLSQPGSVRADRLRFRGYVTFVIPRAWGAKYSRTDNGDANFNFTLAPHCTASGFVHSSTAVTRKSALTQLLTELPQASQPGIPVTRPVSLLGKGALDRGAGGWALVANSGRIGFTFYGGALLKIERARWAGLIVGFAASAGCPAVLPQRATLVADLTRMLRTMHLRDARVT